MASGTRISGIFPKAPGLIATANTKAPNSAKKDQAFPFVANEENYEILEHVIHGGVFNERLKEEDKQMSPEQEMWAQMIWYAVYEASGQGRAKHPCTECHGDYFDEHPELKVGYRHNIKATPHCRPCCPCGHYGVTFQQCALAFLQGPLLQEYLDLCGDLNASYLRKMLVKFGVDTTSARVKINVMASKPKRRMVKHGDKISV